MALGNVRIAIVILTVTAWTSTMAQQSPSYKLAESAVNAGGHPAGGATLASTSYRIRLDAIGDGLAAVGVSSSGFHMDAAFVPAYRPPGEVLGFRFVDKQLAEWDPDSSVGAYELYRGTLSTLPGTFGSCFAGDLSTNSAADSANPAAGQGFFYLATAKNRIREEGTKGYRSNSVERAHPNPCP